MIQPISQQTYDTLCQKWADTINAPGTLCVDTWFPIGGANMRVKQFLLDTQQQARYIQTPTPKLVYVDLAESQGIFAQDIEEQFVFALKIPSSFEEWIEKNHQTVVFFILGLDTSLRSGILQGLQYINDLTKKYPLISCILFTEIDITSCKVDIAHITYQKLYSLEDCSQFYSYLEEKWNFTIPANLSLQLINSIGGHFLLLKETARLILANPTISPEEVLHSPTLEAMGEGWPELKVLLERENNLPEKDRIIKRDNRVDEQDFGLVSTYTDPRVYYAFHSRQRRYRDLASPYRYRMPQGESINDVRGRVREVLSKVTRDHNALSIKNVLVISSTYWQLSAVANIEGWDDETFLTFYNSPENTKLRNGSLTLFEAQPANERHPEGYLHQALYNATPDDIKAFAQAKSVG